MYREGPDLDHSALVGAAVSAVLLAKALLAQYETIAVTVRGQGAAGNFDETSVQIADADRVYSSAWEQLDFARAQLEALERPVPAYDAVRTVVGGGAGQAVMDVQRAEQTRFTAVGQRVRVVTTKTTFNTAGAASAEQAAKILQDAMPEIDWNAEFRARDPGDVDLGRGKRRLVWGAVIALVAGAIYGLARIS